MTRRPSSPLVVDRQSFLRGAALSLLALPFVRARAHAAGAPPVRLIIMTAMNGLVDSARESQFQCTGSDTQLTLSPQLAALEPVKNRVVAFSGLNNNTLAGANFTANGHDPAIRSLLSALPDPFGGVSVDQYIAAQVGASSPFRNVAMRLIDHPKTGFAGPGGTFLSGTQNPATLLKSLFARVPQPGGATTATGTQPSQQRLQRVLDFVLGQTTALRPQLCGSERVLLDSHVDAVQRARRAVSAAAPQTVGAACAVPNPPLDFNVTQSSNMTRVRDAQVEIVAMAAACQLTPVISYNLRPDGDNDHYPFLPGVDAGAIFHDYAHGSSVAKTTINEFVVSSFNKLVLRLQQIPDGNGTLLDNSVVMLVSEMRYGGEHARHDVANLPVVLAGGAGGKLRGGRMLAYQGESFHKILTSLCQLMGVNVNSFGNAGLSAGGLSRLV